MIDIHRVSAYLHDHQVFEDLSLHIGAGEKLAILGPNGAGKSSLLKLISRDMYPRVRDDSHVKLFGSETVNLWELRSKIGLLSQDLQDDYTPWTSALQVILSGFFGAIGAHGHQQPTPAQVQQAEALLQQLGMADYRDTMFQRLSTGQKRRLLVGRALVHQPRALIFDEPFNGLDIGAAAELSKLMRAFCTPEHALLLTTHHVDELIPEIERVVLLQQGRVLMDGAKHQVLTSENLSRLYQLPVRLHEDNGWYRLWMA